MIEATMIFPDDLKRGDILLYSTADLVDRLIEWKEGDPLLPVGHIEIYAGDGESWASRNGIGVDKYPFRADGLVIVRRPVMMFDPHGNVDGWFATVKGTPYGWRDIEAVAGVSLKLGSASGMDCSHFAAILLETACCPQFDPTFPKGAITPDDFKKSRESCQISPA